MRIIENILMHSTSKEAESLIINILLFFWERVRVRGGGGVRGR